MNQNDRENLVKLLRKIRDDEELTQREMKFVFSDEAKTVLEPLLKELNKSNVIKFPK